MSIPNADVHINSCVVPIKAAQHHIHSHLPKLCVVPQQHIKPEGPEIPDQSLPLKRIHPIIIFTDKSYSNRHKKLFERWFRSIGNFMLVHYNHTKFMGCSIDTVIENFLKENKRIILDSSKTQPFYPIIFLECTGNQSAIKEWLDSIDREDFKKYTTIAFTRGLTTKWIRDLVNYVPIGYIWKHRHLLKVSFDHIHHELARLEHYTESYTTLHKVWRVITWPFRKVRWGACIHDASLPVSEGCQYIKELVESEKDRDKENDRPELPSVSEGDKSGEESKTSDVDSQTGNATDEEETKDNKEDNSNDTVVDEKPRPIQNTVPKSSQFSDANIKSHSLSIEY
jgi:hypothetical protein